MSASREKKQRQNVAPSDKTAKARSEQAAYKRKVRTYTAIGVVVVILVAALLTWNSGIFQRNATAATVGDSKISVAEMSYFYNGIRSAYANYGIIDATKPDSEQMYNEEEGTTYRDYFMESALTQAQTTKARYDAALKAGYTVDDVQDDLDETIKYYKNAAAASGYTYEANLRSMYGRYITVGTFEELLTQSLLATKYYNDTVEETSKGYTDEQLAEYYQEHKDDVDTFEYSYLYFKADTVKETDEEGNTLSSDEVAKLKEEAMAKAKEEAEKALAAYQGGLLVSKLITDTTPDASGDHTTVVGTGSISTSYKDELLKLEENGATVVESADTGYYLVIFHKRYQDTTTPATIRDILIKAETTTDENGKVVAPTQEAWDAAKAKADEVLAKWEEGDKTAEAFGELAASYSASSSASNGGISTGVKSGSLTDDRNSWLFEEERTAGDVTTTKHEGDTSSTSSYWGYHITYFQEWEEESWKQTVRSALTSDAMTKWSEKMLEGDAYAVAEADGTKYFGY